jgi:uncharacterized protein YjbJ (UPF0337 family)
MAGFTGRLARLRLKQKQIIEIVCEILTSTRTRHDSKIENGQIPALLPKAEREHGETSQPGHIFHPRKSRKKRTRGAILQTTWLKPFTKQNHEQRKVMNKLEVKGDWNIIKGKLKQKFAKLTDNDLRFVEGQEEELVGRLQKLTGRTRSEIELIIRESL